MRLADSMRIEPGQALAFIGAGGKTSAIARLVDELAPSLPVLVSTTTRLGPGQEQIAERHILAEETGWQNEARNLLAAGRSLLLTGRPDSDGKWTSPADDVLTAARDLVSSLKGVFLIEADGARSRSLKAPSRHEPLVPGFASQVVLLAALDVIGKPLSESSVHRPALAAPIMGLEQGGAIGIEHVVRLLGSPAGGLKGIPAGSWLRCILSRADTAERLAAGSSLAQALLVERRFKSILLCDLAAEDPVRRVVTRTAVVLLAAGGSSRFGRQKLLELWRGEPIIRHVARIALRAGPSELVVVSGAERDRLRAALSDFPLEFVHNPNWKNGQSASLRAGLDAVADHAEAIQFLLGDMPLVEPALIKALFDEHRQTLAPVIAPAFAGRPGNPVLFDQATFKALRAIRGDRGGRAIFDQFPPRILEWDESAVTDIDNVEDLRRLDPDS